MRAGDLATPLPIVGTDTAVPAGARLLAAVSAHGSPLGAISADVLPDRLVGS